MAAFGITFPKLSLCRPTTSKVDTNPISTITTTTTTANTRTLSLSIKNVPSQPLHYDVSTTTSVVKKKPISMANILAIDGETKQLPKNLSVFNELQLDDENDDIDERRKRAEKSSDVIVSSSLSPMGNIHRRSDLRFANNVDSNRVPNEENISIQVRRSNHTFTPPTSSASQNSSSNDVHLSSSTRSIDLPQLKYAIEQFLVDDDDDPIYHIADEFSSGYSQDHHSNAPRSNARKSDSQDQQNDNTDLHTTHDKNISNEGSSRPARLSNGGMKWYVSELRIHRPLIYRTQLTNEQQYHSHRKFSHSVNDLKDIYNFSKSPEKNPRRRTDDIAYSTVSLQNCVHQSQYRPESDDNILINHHLSFTDEDEDDRYFSPLIKRRTLDQSVGKADTLIRNESVKKKLFDILNDDELENACLEDMSEDSEKISPELQGDLQPLNSFSSSSDDALYSSPPSEPYLPPPHPSLLSSSYNEIPSANINRTNEYYFGRSRLMTTSLDKIPINTNSPSTCSLRPSYEQMRPTWYTSPSPQWRMDDQLPMGSILTRHSSRNGNESNRLLSTNIAEYDVEENKNIQKYNHHYRKEQKRVNYSLMHPPTALVENSPTVCPIIQDKSSNLLMFI